MRLTVESFILNSRRIRRVLEYLDAHLDDEPTLGLLADVACCTPSHLVRLYARKLHETPMATLRRLRLNRAHAALMSGQRRAIDVGQDAGYASNAAFTHAFVRQFGYAPTHLKSQPAVQIGRPALRLARSTEEPVIQLPFRGRHDDYWHVGHELVGRTAVSGARRWRIWHSLDEDACLTPAAGQSIDVRAMIPTRYLLGDVAGVDTGSMPSRSYAVFDLYGDVTPSLRELADRIETETSCRLAGGQGHLREVKVSGYTARRERHVELWLPVAARNAAGERALRQLRSTPPPALGTS
ncbi:MAG: AraC family transcriptional regulator [Moraxellaceae bacterium]|nr:AraC family transcriptional regulator [Moraxellaceae bacterium]